MTPPSPANPGIPRNPPVLRSLQSKPSKFPLAAYIFLSLRLPPRLCASALELPFGSGSAAPFPHSPKAADIPDPQPAIRKPQFPPTPAFTIIEMLVAIAISIVLVVLLAGIISQSMIISHKSASELGAENAAAAAMDLIAGDLSTIAATRQPYEYFQTFQDPTSGIGPTTAMSVSPARLLMLSSAAEDASTSSTESGLIHGISYQIQYLDPLPGGAKPIFGLWRTVVSGSNTFNSGSAFPGTILLGSTNQFTTFWSNSIVPNVSSLNTTPQSGIRTDFVAANVVDLETTCYQPIITNGIVSGSASVISNTPYKTGFPPGGVQFTGTNTWVGVVYNSNGTQKLGPSSYSYGYPAYVEVSVTVLEDEGATLWAISSNSGKLTKTILKQMYGHTLTRKIVLPSPQ